LISRATTFSEAPKIKDKGLRFKNKRATGKEIQKEIKDEK
jgi:hypothetical protein